ncbi:hypothetical protein PS15p_204156 [Mucor circinelloides]
MDQLPLEVALLVSKYLPHREKLECALTCHSWCTWFRSNGLFEKVSLHNDLEDSVDSDLEYFPKPHFIQNSEYGDFVNNDPRYLTMLRFFQSSNYGKSVLDLSVNVENMELQHFICLPDIFPNLTKLQWKGNIYNRSEEDKTQFETAVQKWKLIKTVDDGSTCHQITTALLKDTTSASHLKDIQLVYPEEDLPEIFVVEYVDPPEPRIYPPLHLAQKAQSLTAVNAPLTISLLKDELDTINRFTTLKLLNLNYSNEYDDDDATDYMYNQGQDARQPLGEDRFSRRRAEDMLSCQARNVQHLEITVDLSALFRLEHVPLWMNYIQEVYPNLVSFSFQCLDSMIPPILNGFLAYDSNFMHGRQTLKKYCMQFGRFSQDLLEKMQESSVALEDLTVFVNGQSADQFVFLNQSSQRKSIRKLTIKEREKYVDNNGVYGHDMFQFMEQAPQLEAVEIDTFRGSLLHHNPTVIVSILNSAPQIRSIKSPALMSRSSSENMAVSQPSELAHLDISYCQFKLTALGAQNINQTFKNILDKCPLLETFSTQVNIYKDETSTDTNIALVFSFTEQQKMKRIQIKSLYDTYFKIIVNGRTSCYYQKHGERRRPVPNVDETKVYIQIEAYSASIIDTSVMSEAL